MNTIFKVLLVLHISGGSIGLFTGTFNLVRRKGDKTHRLVGKIFTYGMLIAGLSSLALSFIHPNYFLFMVGVFTLYLVATGNRYIYLKLLGKDQRPTFVDWAVTVGMLLAGLLFIGLGIRLLVLNNNFGIVLIVFGALAMRLVRKDIGNYRGVIREKNYWLLAHIQRMTGAYIASATAFLVVNAKYSPVAIPQSVIWLLPTAILTPLIIAWTKKYKVALPPGESSAP